MITLCIDARMAHSSGIGTCIRALVPYFNQPPFRVILLVDRKDQPWCQGIDQILCPAPIYSIQEQLLLPLKIPRCDLFWSPHYNIPLLPIRAKKRIVTIHDACHLVFKQPCAKRAYAHFVMGRAFHHSDIVITDSQFSKGELIRYLGPANVQVIPIAVDHVRFHRVEDTSIRNRYNLPEKFVLFVGNLKPHKNLPSLLQAFEAAALPDRELVIVGKGDSEKLRRKNVILLNKVPNEDLPGLYSLAEMFVLPSFYEGFGLPPLEAMSCGCPTIVSRAASLPEVCGDASLYINPDRPDEIRDAILNVATDSKIKEQLIQKGYERVKLFSWAETARHYRNTFEKAQSKDS